MTPIATFVLRRATESVANLVLATNLEQALTMKQDKVEDIHRNKAALAIPACPPRTEIDDELKSYQERSHRKSSLKRRHSRHSKLDKR